MLYPKANKDGIERLAKVHDATSVPALTSEHLQALEELWMRWGGDRKGVLNKTMFQESLKRLQIDTAEVDRIYRHIDTNGNGEISQDEFAAWYCSDKVKS